MTIGRALVTGGAGFIGSHLATRLVDDGTEVLVVDDLSRGRLEHLAAARRAGRCQTHTLDVRAAELGAVARRFAPEVVFHLAANASVARSVRDPAADASANLVGTVATLAAAAEAGAARVVFTSTAAVYGNPRSVPVTERAARRPRSPYAISKDAAEGYFPYFLEEHGVDYVVLVPANVYGPGQDASGEAGVVAAFAAAMTSGRRPRLDGDGSQTRDFVYVEDVVDALVRAGERGGARTLNVGTGREVSIRELYDVLRKLTGFTRDPEPAPPRPGDIARSALDASAASRHLGWEPFTPLTTGLRRVVDALTARRGSSANRP